jgi:hypothetical protein
VILQLKYAETINAKMYSRWGAASKMFKDGGASSMSSHANFSHSRNLKFDFNFTTINTNIYVFFVNSKKIRKHGFER